MLKLVKPDVKYAGQLERYKDEASKLHRDDAFAGCGLLKTYFTSKQWIENLIKGNVNFPSSTFFAVDENDYIIGIITIQHNIDNSILRQYGGHIGFNVRNSERGKGYGKEIFKLALPECRKIGIKRILITCTADNAACEKIITDNGGIYESTVDFKNTPMKRFWITL